MKKEEAMGIRKFKSIKKALAQITKDMEEQHNKAVGVYREKLPKRF